MNDEIAEVGRNDLPLFIIRIKRVTKCGYSMEEAGELAEHTAILMNVSEFDSITHATDTLVSALQAYKDEGSDVATLSMEIIDKYNEVGNSYAISTSDLAESLTRSSATLVAAGNDLSQSIALTTAANATIQDPNAVGNALKVVAMRLRGTNAKTLEELGEDTDGLVESTSKLREKVLALTSIDGKGGIDILRDDGSYKSTYEILLSISEVWEKINDMDQAALLELLAGKQRGSVVAAILQNGDMLEDVYNSASGAAGSAQHELDTYMDSIEGRIAKFNNAMQTMWSNLISSEFVKWVVDQGTALMELLDTFHGKALAVITALQLLSKIKFQKDLLVGIKELSKGFLDAYNKAGSFGKLLTGIFTKSPVGSILIALAVVTTIVSVVKSLIPTTKDLLSEWENTKTELENVNSELAETKKRIEELEGKEVLSIAEQEELDILRQTNDELERRARLLGKEADGQKADVQKSLEKDYKKDFQRNYGENSTVVDDSVREVWEKQKEELEAQQRVLEAAGDFSSQEYVDLQNQITQVSDLLAQTVRISKEDWIGLATERYDDITEMLKAEDLSDEEAVALYDEKAKLQKGLSAYAAEIYEYLDDYDGSGNDAIVQHWNGILEQIDKTINPIVYKTEEFNKIMDQYSDQKEKLAELALQGKLTEDVLNSSNYSGLMSELAKIGIGADDVVEHFNSMSIKSLDQIIDPSFDISNYTSAIDVVEGSISTYKGALESLESGSFTPSEFIELISLDPDLAKDVDLVSGSYKGLAKNLQKAISKSPDSLTKDLRELREELVKLGKDTTAIDQLIESVENMPTTAIDNAIAKYGLLADEISEANAAQSKLSAAMSEDPDANYQNTSQAMQQMKDLIEHGVVGSESKIWDIYEALTGKSYDYQLSVEQNKQALQNWINTYDRWYLGQDDEEYSTAGITNFLNGVERMVATAKDSGEEWAQDLVWSFENGVAKIDWGNTSWDDIAAGLGITTEMFADLMMRVGQFIEVDWTTADNMIGFFNELANSGKSVVEQLAEADAYVKGFLQKENLDLAWLEGSEESVIDGISFGKLSQDMQAVLQGYWELRDAVANDPLEITAKLKEDELSVEQEKIAKEMQEKFDQTPIDLTVRPKVSAEAMREKGWENIQDGEYATVNSITVTASELGLAGAEDDYAINLTPILPDGTVLGGRRGEDDFKDWVREQLASGKDIEELDVFLGSYKGSTIEESIDQAIAAANLLHDLQQDFDNAEVGLSEGQIASLNQLVRTVRDTDTGTTWLSFDELRKAAKAAGYTEQGINDLVAALESYGDAVLDLKVTDDDPLGLLGMRENVDAAVNYLNALDIQSFNIAGDLHIDLSSFVTQLKNAEMSVDQTKAYIDKLLGEGFVFTDQGQTLNINSNAEEVHGKVTDLYNTAEQAPDEQIKINVTGNAESKLDSIIGKLGSIQSKTVYVTTVYRTQGSPSNSSGGGYTLPRGPRVNGSAHASGDWGLPRAEHNALVGELGQELVVDPNSGMYYTVGDRGAEMVDLPKDAIIFNHKQTEALLKHGYVTGRGKAYASGTAHANIFQAVGNWVKTTVSNVVAAVTGNNAASTQSTPTKSTTTTTTTTKPHSREKRVGEGTVDVVKGDQVNTPAPVATSYNAEGPISSGGGSGGGNGGGYGGGGSSGGGSSSNDTEEPEESTLDFIEFKIEEIEALIEKITAKIALFLDDTSDIIEKDSYYDQLVEAEKNKAETYLSAAEVYNQKAAELLEEVPSHYHEFAQNGALAIEDFIGEEDQEIVEAIDAYREYAQKADDAEVGYLESIAQAAAYRVEQLEDIATDFENLTNQIETQSGLVDSHMNLIEESGNIISEKFYQDLMSKTIDQRKELKREKKALQKILNDAVKSGDVIVGTDEWFEMVQAIYDVDEAIVQCDIDLESYQNSINELNWESFERLLDQLDEIDSELSFIADLMTKNDWEIVDEDSNWTDKGITALGMYAQQMELAQTKSQQYGEEIKELDKLHKKGLISETEYTEKLAELKEGQRDAIGAYEDAKDAIVDLNKVRIESIKKGLDKELEAYQELIEKKKEALEADRDLYDFEKNVAEQQKNIADIQRKIAALSGDNSLSATAQRRKLEAELLEAQAELEDTYRDRQYDNTINALDKESEAYAESIDTQKEALDKSLENVDAIVTESLGVVRTNTETVMSELLELSETYSIQLSEEITSPWEDGTAAISAYRDSFVALKDSFSAELAELIEQEKALQEQADKSAAAVLSSISKNESTVERVKSPKSSSSSSSSSSEGVVSGISGDLQYGDEGDNVKALQRALNSLGFKAGTVDGIFGDNTKEALMRFQSSSKYGGAIDADGIVGTKTKKKFNIAGYAKGTTGLKEDQWAWINEIGEELILVPGPNGTLSHMIKGTGIVPADITENIMKIGQLDPTEMLKRSTPRIGAPHITNTEINLTMDIGSVVNIEHVDNDTIPDLTKAVEKQMDKYMKNLNQQIRKFSR